MNKQKDKDHLMYVMKFPDNRFKFGVTTNVTGRISNFTTTYGTKPILIGESTTYCTKDEALECETILKNQYKTGEYCSANQASNVINSIRRKFGFKSYNNINIKTRKVVKHKL